MAALPQLVKQAPPITTHPFKIHIAIDFGTDGTALAYALSNTKKKVFVHKEWNSSKFEVGLKPKTIVLLDEDYDVLAFGKDAKHMYMSASQKKSQKWMLFERFKMSLYDDGNLAKSNEKIGIKQVLRATNGKKVKSSVVFVAVFQHLQKLAMDLLKRKRIKGIKDEDIQWIITVPAIWNDAAKLKMREWTISAGLVSESIEDQCKIVYEPDCASLAIQHCIHHNKSRAKSDDFDDDDDVKTNDNVNYKCIDKETWNKGDKYILVDAGGGTVDIACHEILGENGQFGVKEVLAPSGGPWGGCYIDDKFVQLLKDVFGAEWIDEFRRSKPNHFTKLMDNFQKSKELFWQKSDESKYNVRLPFDFVGFVQDKLEHKDQSKEIEDFVETSKVFGVSNLVSVTEEYLEISMKGWQIMFDYVVHPITKHIEKLLQAPKMMMNCKYLCLVGGLSTSPYFQSKLRKTFGPKSMYKLSLIIPQRPILSVVAGAAYFGITENYIKARVLQFTYGILRKVRESKARQLGVSNEHIKKYMTDGWVRECFTVIARKGEDIHTGQVKKQRAFRNGLNHKRGKTIVMVSDKKNPLIKSDGIMLGKVTTEYTDQDKPKQEHITEFHFYDTLIKVVTYKTQTPHERQKRYILNYQ